MRRGTRSARAEALRSALRTGAHPRQAGDEERVAATSSGVIASSPTSVLKSAISEVRAALDDDPKQPRYIETVWRHGYRFIAAAVGSSTQSAAAVERKGAGGPDHPALAALMALCRGDAALADLIRAVAATLERDATLTAFPPNADGSLTNGR